MDKLHQFHSARPRCAGFFATREQCYYPSWLDLLGTSLLSFKHICPDSCISLVVKENGYVCLTSAFELDPQCRARNGKPIAHSGDHLDTAERYKTALGKMWLCP